MNTITSRPDTDNLPYFVRYADANNTGVVTERFMRIGTRNVFAKAIMQDPELRLLAFGRGSGEVSSHG